jgi:hypothetical protein
MFLVITEEMKKYSISIDIDVDDMLAWCVGGPSIKIVVWVWLGQLALPSEQHTVVLGVNRNDTE